MIVTSDLPSFSVVSATTSYAFMIFPIAVSDSTAFAVVFLMAAVVGGSGAVFLAFTLSSLVTTGEHVFFCVS